MLINWLREKMMRDRIYSDIALYEKNIDPIEIHKVQLELWNKEWTRISQIVPFYRNLKKTKDIRDRFSSWDEFAEKIPVTTKEDMRMGVNDRVSSKKMDFYRITGGSTAKPIQMPAWKSETHEIQSDQWVGRSWYGLKPSSKLFLIWGHSHLFGKGFMGYLNRIKRLVSDRLLGYMRVSAYDLSRDSLRKAFDRFVKYNPQYIYGYSTALDLFVRANFDRKHIARSIRLKVVIGTAERFPSNDSEGLIADFFDCPVSMEYGSVETGVIAHKTPPNNIYKVFWKHYFLESASQSDSLHNIVRITSLYPRCFPLVRYELGDYIDSGKGQNMALGLNAIREVIGRCNDLIILENGKKIHSELFSHAIKDIRKVSMYQIIYGLNYINFNYVAASALDEVEKNIILSRLEKIEPTLRKTKLVHVKEMKNTIAGKTPMVIREY